MLNGAALRTCIANGIAAIASRAPVRLPPVRPRDRRLDLVRGVALICIFIDHLPGNFFSRFTLHAYGFIDAADVFVFVAGISAGIAYWATFVQKGWMAGLKRVGRRVLQIYGTHLFLIVACGVIIWLAATASGDLAMRYGTPYTAVDADLTGTVWHALTLQFQPIYLNILPVYVVLLAALPLVLLLTRVHPLLALFVSLGVWMLPRTTGIDLPSAQHTHGWYFNPLSWQLVFTLGVLWGQRWRLGLPTPRSAVLLALAAAYCAFALLAMAPWSKIPALSSWHILPHDWMGSVEKERLSPLRLVNVLALAYLTVMLVPASARWLESRPARIAQTLGRNSLTVFAVGALADMAGWIAWETGARSVASQAVAIVAGTALMIAASSLRARQQQPLQPPATAHAA